eukprot:NODE_5983_length_476_cov_629.227166_g4506_i0.p3 GENE.NODE_5983_length_476_cov_629.227166_g4506_i0~~NODE_5983_length_476_cov_629.227166_g4506_i0.p3  ORF type:complete len:122 (+),score=67.88 NODE_5983_length_476_cov_629.227166_g4506_i0:36-368(+)
MGMGLGDIVQNATIFSPGITYAGWAMTMAPLLMVLEGFFRVKARKGPSNLVSPRYIWRDTVAMRVTKKQITAPKAETQAILTRIPADLANIRSDAKIGQNMVNLAALMKA